jgi:hypothetical protein
LKCGGWSYMMDEHWKGHEPAERELESLEK